LSMSTVNDGLESWDGGFVLVPGTPRFLRGCVRRTCSVLLFAVRAALTISSIFDVPLFSLRVIDAGLRCPRLYFGLTITDSSIWTTARYTYPWNTDNTVPLSSTTHQYDPSCPGSRSHLSRSEWDQASLCISTWVWSKKVLRSSMTSRYDIPGTGTAEHEASDRRFLLDETVLSATRLAPHLSSQETVFLLGCFHFVTASSIRRRYPSQEVKWISVRPFRLYIGSVWRSVADAAYVASLQY